MATLTLTAAANAAAQFLHVLDSGESLSTQQVADALAAGNDMIDSWSSDRLMALSAKVDTQATVAGTVSYALATRYSAIEAASVLSPAPLLPIEVVNGAKWASIPDRGVSSSLIRILLEIVPDRVDVMTLLQSITLPASTVLAPLVHLLLDKTGDRMDLIISLANAGFTNAAALAGLLRLPGTPQGAPKPPDMLTVLAALNNQPRYLFYDRGFATGTIYLGGPPQTGTIQFLAWNAMSPFADATTPLTMTPAFARLFKLALAVEIAPQYDTAPSQRLLDDYAEAKATWRQLNASIFGTEPGGGIVTPAQAGQ